MPHPGPWMDRGQLINSVAQTEYCRCDCPVSVMPILQARETWIYNPSGRGVCGQLA